MARATLNAQALQNAFSQFNEQSSLLEASYRELQEKVSTLTQELAVSRTARHSELLEKERLGHRLAHMLEALPGAIIVIDECGVIQESNSKASDLLNTPLIGCAWSEIVQREFCPGESADGELRLNDGRWLSLSRQPLDNESAEILLLTDITESRRMSEMLQRQQRLSCIGEMTARLGHQIRTPLASALLYASNLAGAATATQKHTVDKILGRLQDLRCTVDDMLRYASGAKNSGESIEVATLLQDVADAIEPQLASAADVRVEISDPELSIAANREALKGALLNLVTNAIQACGDNPQVELGAVQSSDQVFLTVTDNGPGFSEGVQERIFEPFFTTRPQGTGLGLAVVRSVAEAHDGEVLADSGPNGTTFALCLPKRGLTFESDHFAEQQYA